MTDQPVATPQMTCEHHFAWYMRRAADVRQCMLCGFVGEPELNPNLHLRKAISDQRFSAWIMAAVSALALLLAAVRVLFTDHPLPSWVWTLPLGFGLLAVSAWQQLRTLERAAGDRA